MPELYRQGDVLFKRIEALPKGEQTKRQNATVAYGEVTGHSHTVMSLDEAEVVEIGGDVHVRVSERGLSIEGDIARIVPDLQRIVADEEDLPLRRKSAADLLQVLPHAGAIFLHGTEQERRDRPVPLKGEDRHLPTALLPGVHEVLIQREYSQQETRNVID
jgi:hypothetical protein